MGKSDHPARMSIWRRYAYAWLTLLFFVGSFALHWYFGWRAFVAEAQANDQVPQLADYLNQMGRDTFENWQSEFLQLLWQVVGLAYFLYLGSPASKENDDRVEAKIDAILKHAPGGKKALEEIDREYMRHHGHAKPHGHSAR